MIIEKIIKQLTPERVKKEVEAIQKVKLPPSLQKWVKEYEKVGERDEFICKWTYQGMKNLTFSSVAKKYQSSVCADKTMSIILNFLIDDIADKRRNGEMLNTAINLCSSDKNNSVNPSLSNFNEKDQKYLSLIKKIWFRLKKNIKKYPRYTEFKDVFFYDYQQFFNAMKYAYLINKNLTLINLTENQIYLSHNMQGIISSTIDLMASSRFNSRELGCFREIVWRAQRMGRIGNSLTTWERELCENDFTSEVFAFAIKNRLIKKGCLESKEKIIKKIKNKIRGYFLKEWEKNYNGIKQIRKEIKSVNVKKILKGLEKLIMMHLISKGLK